MKSKQKNTKKPSAKRTPIHKSVSHHAKKVLIPHKGNEWRPHLIRPHGLTIVVILALVAQFGYTFLSTGNVNVLGRESDIQTVDLLNYTNKARATNGLAELQLNDQLSQAAFLKANDMFEAQYWAHTSPSGAQPWKWFKDAGYNYSYAGENLAKNYPTAQATVDAWMNSETHKANVLNKEYIDVGFAVVSGDLDNENTTIIVAMYGSPVTVAAVQSAVEQQVNFSAPAVGATASSMTSVLASTFSSMSPVTIAILGLLTVVALVAAAAHHYRRNLPKSWQKSWRAHHGMFTFWGVIIFGVLIIVATGGGQI